MQRLTRVVSRVLLAAAVLLTLARWVVPLPRALTKMSDAPLVSPGTRLVDQLAQATTAPSPERAGQVTVLTPLSPRFWGPPAELVETLVMCGLALASQRRMSHTV